MELFYPDVGGRVTKMRSVIGVFPSTKDDSTIWLYENYTDALVDLGAIPLVIPMIPIESKDVLFDLMDGCDGFLFTGGIDIDPCRYGEERWEACNVFSQKRDEFELLAMSYALGLDKPILGICRGCQLINVALGGTLCQDIPTAHPSALKHTSDSRLDPAVHEIIIPELSPLYKLSDSPRVKINSFHHQCVDKLGHELKILATSVDGIPEGVYLDGDRFIIGVQWHPERSYKTSPLDAAVFSAFISAAEKRSKQA